jgi:hypothetical protein
MRRTVKNAESTAKPASIPTVGLLATLRASANFAGSGAPFSTLRRTLPLSTALAALALLAPVAASAAPANFCPQGSAAGKCDAPVGVAADTSTGNAASGDVYIADKNNQRVAVFDKEGHFLRAFGVGVTDGAPELETCEAVCIRGPEIQPDTVGLRPVNVAVDPGSHEVYAYDSLGLRVQKFTPSGKLQLMFGGGVLNGGATGTGDLTAGSAIVTSVATTSRFFAAGQTVTGTGIPPGTRIVAVKGSSEETVNPAATNPGATLTLSQPATATATDVALAAPTPAANVPVNEVQKISLGGAPTGGTFSMEFDNPSFWRRERELGGDLIANTTAGSTKVASVGQVEAVADLTAGSSVIHYHGGQVLIGEVVSGVGIPPGTTVINAGGNGSGPLELSAEVTASGSAVPLTFSARGTANVTAGSNIVEITGLNAVETQRQAATFRTGETISGPGIPAGTTIIQGAVNESRPNTIELSADATASGTGVTLTAVRRVPLIKGESVSGPGIPAGATVAAVGSEGAFNLSTAATASTEGAGLHAGIPFDASAAQLQSLLESLPTIGAGNVAVSGSPGGPWTVEFKGRLADTNVSEFGGPSGAGLTPSGTVTIATETQGASAPEVCTAAEVAAGDSCEAGARGSEGGQFSGGNDPLAVDSAGHLWAGDDERLEEFSAAGEFLAEVKLPGAGEVTALGVDPSGDFYVLSTGVAGVQKLKSDGEPIETLDGSGNPRALAVDPAGGNLFVSDQAFKTRADFGKATLLEYDPAGALIEAFGAGEVIGAPKDNALAVGTGRLYTASSATDAQAAAQAFPIPPPGPLPLAGTGKATLVTKTSATLCAQVNPEGDSTTAHFEYITAAKYKEDGESFGAGTVKTTESGPIGSDFSPHEICQPISPLTPATAYRFRLVAANSNAPGGIDGEAASFESLPPAAIDSTGATDVTAESATLKAEINPLGEATSYRFEYLTEAAYLANGESFSGPEEASRVPIPDGEIGKGSQDVAVSQHIQGLQPHTTYRFRVVVHNKLSEENGGPFAGPVRAFTTQGFAASGLPDRRAWELVSPADKRGALLIGIGEAGLAQASRGGDAISYLASAPTEAEPAGGAIETQIVSSRGPAGWASKDLNSPHTQSTAVAVGIGQEYRFFSEDLSTSVVEPRGPFEADLLSPAATQRTPLLRTVFPQADPTAFCVSSCYRPLLTACPPGPKAARRPWRRLPMCPRAPNSAPRTRDSRAPRQTAARSSSDLPCRSPTTPVTKAGSTGGRRPLPLLNRFASSASSRAAHRTREAASASAKAARPAGRSPRTAPVSSSGKAATSTCA